MGTCKVISTIALTNGSTPWNGRGLLQVKPIVTIIYPDEGATRQPIFIFRTSFLDGWRSKYPKIFSYFHYYHSLTIYCHLTINERIFPTTPIGIIMGKYDLFMPSPEID